ncbi:MAG: hypothetical protein VB018_04040 [Lachnospiraceae bacterium]|nr:hypothetical protein [Lachnospiraceae bacterium]
MKQYLKYAFLAAVGGWVYCFIEILWRGYTSPTMAIVGGICFILCGSINEFLEWDTALISQMFICSIIITAVEFIAGVLINIICGLSVWNYSQEPYNLYGQVCLLYTNLWFILSAAAIILDDYLRYWLFKEDKPKYKIF